MLPESARTVTRLIEVAAKKAGATRPARHAAAAAVNRMGARWSSGAFDGHVSLYGADIGFRRKMQRPTRRNGARRRYHPVARLRGKDVCRDLMLVEHRPSRLGE